ncbi:hypothetical protein BO70DRAFT_199113 [Aspergillus heteromorphus CBS 117.55]|uniref:Uncharacterized protein n=1 Tax=Aspergillus heteromorphus CBS 117.55 TaxID=1448321 RepID=A0A317WRA1_9EURO|nr:uncharacterized protein BO70DRAFT_199113 [Aspergillus heteromorphus CBS 117.55]PWY87647.1 hypothetical protein BO70DRAFT_199113 [Aspergillus heteromorphus CBS 117.55]
MEMTGDEVGTDWRTWAVVSSIVVDEDAEKDAEAEAGVKKKRKMCEEETARQEDAGALRPGGCQFPHRHKAVCCLGLVVVLVWRWLWPRGDFGTATSRVRQSQVPILLIFTVQINGGGEGGGKHGLDFPWWICLVDLVGSASRDYYLSTSPPPCCWDVSDSDRLCHEHPSSPRCRHSLPLDPVVHWLAGIS